MKTIPLAQVAKLPAGSRVGATFGLVKDIGIRTTSKADAPRPWSLQHVLLEDGGRRMRVGVWNRDPLPKEWEGKVLLILAKEAGTGNTFGMKVKDVDGVLQLEVTASATLQMGEQTKGDIPEPATVNTESRSDLEKTLHEQVVEVASSVMAKTIREAQAAAAKPLTTTTNTPQGTQTTSVPVTSPKTDKPKCRCVEIRYDRTVNIGDYCSEKIGITLAVEDGEKAAEVFALAKRFVLSACEKAINAGPRK